MESGGETVNCPECGRFMQYVYKHVAAMLKGRRVTFALGGVRCNSCGYRRIEESYEEYCKMLGAVPIAQAMKGGEA